MKKKKRVRKDPPRRPRLLAGDDASVRMLIDGMMEYPVRVVVTKRKKWTIRNGKELKKLLPTFDEYCKAGGKLCIEPVKSKGRRR